MLDGGNQPLGIETFTLQDIFVSRNPATLATNRLLTSIGSKRSELCPVA
jgi:hypothetical protein